MFRSSAILLLTRISDRKLYTIIITLGVLISFNPLPVAKPVPIH